MMLLRLSTAFILCFSSLSATNIFSSDKNEPTYDSRTRKILAETETTVESVTKKRYERNFLLEQSKKSIHSEAVTEKIIDLSYFSPEFLNCTHAVFEPDSYEKLDNGSIYVPQYQMSFDKSNYLITDNLLFLCPVSEIDVTMNMTDFSYLSPEFFNCTHINLEAGSYEKLDNGSVYVPLYHMSFDKRNYLINNESLFLCPNFYEDIESTEKFSRTISTVSIVCIGISTICIILHIMMFAMVRRLRNLPGWILLSLCVALMSAYVCSYIQYEITNRTDCVVIGMFLLYFFLASFFWMNTMAYDVWRSIRMATAKFRLTTDRPIKVRFARYSIYSWGIPLAIVISSIIVHHTTSNIKYQLIFNINTCWFAYKQALTVYFAIPLFVLLGLNVFFFISSFYMVTTAAMSKSASGSPNRSDLWSRLFLSLRLSSVMGLMWIFGIIAAVTEQQWLWYFYAICNALQGVFIFFSFTVSERSRNVCKKAYEGRRSSASRTQTTTSQAQKSTAA